MASADEKGTRLLSGLESPTGGSQHASQDDTLRDEEAGKAAVADGAVVKKPSAEVVATEADDEEEDDEEEEAELADMAKRPSGKPSRKRPAAAPAPATMKKPSAKASAKKKAKKNSDHESDQTKAKKERKESDRESDIPARQPERKDAGDDGTHPDGAESTVAVRADRSNMNKFSLLKDQGLLPARILTELEEIEALKLKKCGSYRTTLRDYVEKCFTRVDGKLQITFGDPVITKSAKKTKTQFGKNWHAGILREEVEAGGMSSEIIDKLILEGKYKEAMCI